MKNKSIPLLFGLFSISHSQNSDVRGIVSDSTTGERIPFATVSIVSLGRGASANTVGFYIIPNIPLGIYEITASSVGYKKQVKTISLAGDVPFTVNFELSVQPIEQEAVVVTFEKTPEQLKGKPSIHVLEQADVKKVPVSAQPDLFKAIQLLPGIVSISDVNAQFYVRGGASDQNIILLDGMKIYNPLHTFGLFSSFDPDLIRAAVVYTGAFPVDFGGRLSSVVNISTRDGSVSRFCGQANVNSLSSKLQLEGPVAENFQTIATFRRSVFQNTFKSFLKEDLPLTFYDGFAKLTYKSNESNDKYSVQFFTSEDNLRPTPGQDLTYKWSTRVGGVEADFLRQDRLYVTTFSSFGQFEQRLIVGPSEQISPTSNVVKDLSLRAVATYYTDFKDIFDFGFEFNSITTSYEFNRVYPVTLPSSTLELSLWSNYRKHFEDMTADIGVRAEMGSLLRGLPFSSSIQPRLNVSVDLLDDWKLKAAYGRFAQQLITVSNEDDIIPVFTPWIAVPDNLRPEQADHYVVGISGNPYGNFSLSLEAFYKNHSSIVTYNRDKFRLQEPDYINSTSKSYGAEALTRFSYHFFDLYFSYSLGWVTIDQKGFVYSPKYDRRHTMNVLSTFNLFTGLALSFRWQVGSGLPYTSIRGFYDKLTLGDGYPNTYQNETGDFHTIYGDKNASRLPSYHRLDAAVSYQPLLFERFHISCGVNLINAYDQKNVLYVDPKSGRVANQIEFFPSFMMQLELLP